MIAYLPHTEEDIKMMLAAIGITDIEQLFADIPHELTLEKPLEIPEGITEFEVYRRMQALAAREKQVWTHWSSICVPKPGFLVYAKRPLDCMFTSASDRMSVCGSRSTIPRKNCPLRCLAPGRIF